jgi:tetratricopeptide (TPR) repeat protein
VKQDLPPSTSHAWQPALAALALFALAFGLTSSAGLTALPLVALAWVALALWTWGLTNRLDAALWGLAALLPVALALLVTWLADALTWGSLAGLFLFYLAALAGVGIVAWLLRRLFAPLPSPTSSRLPLLRRAGTLAVGLLALFLVLRPAAADVLHKSGLLIATGGNVPAGLAWVTRATGWNPGSDTFRYSRARLLSFEAAEPGLTQAEVRARWTAGAEVLEVGWQAHPHMTAYAGWLAEYHLMWSDQDEPDVHLAAAEGYYRRGVDEFPGNVEWWARLGDVLRRGGQYVPAQTVIMAALARAPRYYPAYLGLGDLLKEQGNTTRAIDTYRQAITAAPWAPEPYMALADTLASQGQRDQALAAARTALSLAIGHPAESAAAQLLTTLEQSNAP